jgi:hypothetical protein
MARMRAESCSSGWLSGVAALAVHAAAWLGLPAAQPARATPEAVAFELAFLPQITAEIATPVQRIENPIETPARKRTSARAHRPARASNVEAAPTLPLAQAGELAAPGGEIGSEEGSKAGAKSGSDVASPSPSVTRPALIATRDPCLGFFPARANVDHGRVQISVRVDEQGRAHPSEVVVEAPLGHDFGRAARACASALRFQPARDAQGVAVAGDAKLELHFHRS